MWTFWQGIGHVFYHWIDFSIALGHAIPTSISPTIQEETRWLFHKEAWSARLGQIPAFITKLTYESTAQFANTVEAETKTMPCRHFKVRMPPLRLRRCQEGFHSDAFFSDTRSTWGFECGHVFVGAKSSYTYVDMMKGKGYAPSALWNCIRDAAAPSYIHTDNAYEEVLGEWEEVCKTYCMSQITSEPHHWHLNKAEIRIQDIKKQSRLQMQLNNTPDTYWNFATESMWII